MSTISRSHTMSCIHSKNTKPEIIVRRHLWRHGFRYRLNHPRLPGKPDIVLRKYRTCIFVNGCFWHGHEECGEFRAPKTNVIFWTNKINSNKKRDHDVQISLAKMGWHSITIWECELKPTKREKTLESLTYTLNKIFLQNHSVKRYEIIDKESMIAAECEIKAKLKAEAMRDLEAFREIRKMAESGELLDLTLEEINEEIRLARHNKATP